MKQKGIEVTSEFFSVINSGYKAKSISIACIGIFITLTLILPLISPAHASEGGSSSFTPGAQGDFGMCYYPQGLYFRENIVYTDGTLKNYPAAVQTTEQGAVAVDAKLNSKVWFDLLQILYASNFNILGGRYFTNINIPLGFSAKLNTKASIPAAPSLGIVSQEDVTTSGLGDIQAVPFGIVWDKDDIHYLFAQNFVLTTGRYDANKTDNMGRNYFSYDEVIGFTWLDQNQGHEISFIAGYMINTKNQATDYRTGDELHIDYTLAQYFSKEFGIGVVGYYYKQMQNDKSPILDEINAADRAVGLTAPGGYKSKGAAAGPALIFTPTIGGHDVNLIAKWLREFSMTDRLEGDWVWLSAVVKF